MADSPDLSPPSGRWKTALRSTLYIVGALLIFLFAIELMIAAFGKLGNTAAETIILATSNPFTGLFIGLLISAILQSSSTTTSLAVALVASGSINLPEAVPIIMGANVGTTITSTLVSLAFIRKKKEFKRAVTAGTYHDWFNILTVIILFPLEYYYGVLSGLSQFIATALFEQPLSSQREGLSGFGLGFGFLVNPIAGWISSGFLLVILALVLVYGSLLFFRKVISQQLGIGTQDRFQRFFFRNTFKSFGWGLLITAAVRSSTITTSLVVPLVAKRVVRLKEAIPFILGANVGTTITAFIAALFNSQIAISIALAHLLFNVIGVLLFSLTPGLREVPTRLASGLGRLTLKYRLTVFLYVLVFFFFVPFTLIYAHKNTVSVRDITYERVQPDQPPHYYQVIAKTYANHLLAGWMVHDPTPPEGHENPQLISIYRKNQWMIINNELYELNKPGFCRDGEDKRGKYQMCIRMIEPQRLMTTSLSFDSVYVFEKRWYEDTDSTARRMYISAPQNLLLMTEYYNRAGQVLMTERLVGVRER